MSFDFEKIRSEFPALDYNSQPNPFVYLDSAATALKPLKVIDALMHFYKFETANVHRGAHKLSALATEKFEKSRETVRAFLNAKSSEEIVFTKGTTESLNLLATVFSSLKWNEGDEIVLTEMEHHSNIVPWQNLAEQCKLIIKWLPVDTKGEISLDILRSSLSPKTRLVCVTHCSNTLGTVNPIREITQLAHEFGAWVVVDAAQSVSFKKLDVRDLDCDFLAFSGHKVYGPFGVGVLYGKKELLNDLEPYQFGGAMIKDVSKEGSTFLPAPQRFEAGTPNISGVIGMAAALEFVQEIGLEKIANHATDLISSYSNDIRNIPRVRMIGDSVSRVNLFSFVVDGLHSSDIGTLLDQQGVAVRVGHHCTSPLMKKFDIGGTIRVSIGVYNSVNDLNIFKTALKKSLEILT